MSSSEKSTVHSVTKLYCNCFKFKCKEFESLNDIIVKNVDVSWNNGRVLKVLTSPMVKSDIFKILDRLVENSVNIDIDLTDEFGTVIDTAVSGCYQLVKYDYILCHSRICSDNEPLYIKLEFAEITGG